MIRCAVIVASVCATAHADPQLKSTTLMLSRARTRPARLLAKNVDIEIVRAQTPCALRLVIEPQHTLFKRFAITVFYQVNAGGAVTSSKSPTTLDVVAVGAEPITTKHARVEIIRKKAHDFDAKLEGTFDYSSSQWTLTGTVRIEGDTCVAHSSTE